MPRKGAGSLMINRALRIPCILLCRAHRPIDLQVLRPLIKARREGIGPTRTHIEREAVYAICQRSSCAMDGPFCSSITWLWTRYADKRPNLLKLQEYQIVNRDAVRIFISDNLSTPHVSSIFQSITPLFQDHFKKRCRTPTMHISSFLSQN